MATIDRKVSLKQQAINAIIRPPRKQYDLDSLTLFLENEGQRFIRHPLTFTNKRGQTIVGSLYHAANFNPVLGGPCVIYLHGNSSSQLEAQFLVPNLCPHGIFVFAFDFVGCGNSDGDYVSLGFYESQDTDFLITTLHQMFSFAPFILWGRSMGAATAIMASNPYVIGKIVDSSFSSLEDLCIAIGQSLGLPTFFVSPFVSFLRGWIHDAAGFNLDSVSPIEYMYKNPVPLIIGHAKKDQFIPIEQAYAIFDKYPDSMKIMSVLPGGHNSKRDKNWIKLGITFILQRFSMPLDNLKISECRNLQSADFHFSSFNDMVMSTTPSSNDADIELTADVSNIPIENSSKKGKKRRHKHRHHHHRHSHEIDGQEEITVNEKLVDISSDNQQDIIKNESEEYEPSSEVLSNIDNDEIEGLEQGNESLLHNSKDDECIISSDESNENINSRDTETDDDVDNLSSTRRRNGLIIDQTLDDENKKSTEISYVNYIQSEISNQKDCSNHSSEALANLISSNVEPNTSNIDANTSNIDANTSNIDANSSDIEKSPTNVDAV